MYKLSNKNIQNFSLSFISFSVGYFIGHYKFPFNLFDKKNEDKSKECKKKKRGKDKKDKKDKKYI